MKLNFEASVFLGYECSGKCHCYQGLVPIDLTTENIRILKSQISPNEHGDIVKSLQKGLPELYEKINKEMALFATYATLHEGLINGTLEENLSADKTIEDFILEDTKSGVFNPSNENVPESIKEDWYKWEENYLEQLPYQKRIQYIAQRYGIDEKTISSIENDYSLFLPEEIMNNE